jgi:hypothetical protein
VLRKIFGPKKAKLTGERRRLHNKEPYALHVSPNIILAKKNQRNRWAEHVACMGERGGAYRVVVRRLEGKNNLEDLGVNMRGKMYVQEVE